MAERTAAPWQTGSTAATIAATAPHPAAASPRNNLLLAALPATEYDSLLPHLKPIRLPLGWIMHFAGDRETSLYFITSGIVSRYNVMMNGATAGHALTGREGMIGIASILGGASTPTQAVVVSTGFSWRLRIDALPGGLERHSALQQLLYRYTEALMTETAQSAACNRHHSVEQQLCRWVLSTLDRSPSNELVLTHELIAGMLGVRREGVSEAAAALQKAGLIHSSRGRMTVLDRAGLEARACECYAVVRRAYEQMRVPRSRSANAAPRGIFAECLVAS